MDISATSGRRVKGLSFINYLRAELRRGYLLENDEERYAARREKVYTFFKIPREIEKFLAYGFFQSADSFLFVLTFLPIRFILALWCLLTRPLKQLFGFGRNMTRLMKPAEVVDLLKGALLIICCYVISYIDTSVWYHIIKTQSTIKLYLFFNMLEIADRLMSAFGQDTLDALFWTATEPRDRKREHFGMLFHLIVSSIYVVIHSGIVLLQALSLNVAINSDNKGLLAILISNNFVELKGAVFKKFDRNNLLQISCSDVRERFHICILLFIVVIQTMKEYSWKEERLWILLPDCLLVLGTEVLIDWVKHAFIIRFNDIPIESYRDFTLLIASDLIICKQKYAYSDHSDLVARRMGFIPIPLGVVIFRILSQSLSFSNITAVILCVFGFLCLLSFRVLNGVIILGKACNLINNAELQISRNAAESIDKSYKSLIDGVKTPAKNSNNSNTTSAKHLGGNVSTPLRHRRRTKSQSRERNFQLEDKIEDLSLNISMVAVENMRATKTTVSSSYNDRLSTSFDEELCKATRTSGILDSLENSNICRRSVSNDPTRVSHSNLSNQMEEFTTSSTSLISSGLEERSELGFLGESQFGLMANSMVNLSSVGLNQGITDHNSSSSIVQAISPDVSSEQSDLSISFSGSLLNESDCSQDITVLEASTSKSNDEDSNSSKSFELELSARSAPLTATRSCPNVLSSYTVSSKILETNEEVICSMNSSKSIVLSGSSQDNLSYELPTANKNSLMQLSRYNLSNATSGTNINEQISAYAVEDVDLVLKKKIYTSNLSEFYAQK